MPSNVFRFDESWDIPEASPQEVWDVLSDAELLPLWWGDVYKEVVPNEKLVFSWAWYTTAERVSQVTVTTKADGEGTLLTLKHEQFFDQAACDGHTRGWTATMEKLAAYLEQQQ